METFREWILSNCRIPYMFCMKSMGLINPHELCIHRLAPQSKLRGTLTIGRHFFVKVGKDHPAFVVYAAAILPL